VKRRESLGGRRRSAIKGEGKKAGLGKKNLGRLRLTKKRERWIKTRRGIKGRKNERKKTSNCSTLNKEPTKKN